MSDLETFGLAARRALEPEEMVALAAAGEQLMREGRRVVVDPLPAWRFSGRWFNAGPYALRRPHDFN